MNDEFDQICRDSNAEVTDLTKAARELICELDPDVVEVIWERQKIAGYGVGPKKMTEHYVYLSPFAKHLNLGFYRGALLPDLTGTMEGSGKELRHIKVRSLEQLEQPELSKLIKLARDERVDALKQK